MARGPVLTEDDVRKVAQLIKQGNYPKIAAASVGITERTYYNYLERGALLDKELLEQKRRLTKNEKLYLSFFHSVNRADAEFEVETVKTINLLRMEKPELAFKVLERRHRKRWAPETRIVGDADRPVGITPVDETARRMKNMTPEEIEQMIALEEQMAALEERAGSRGAIPQKNIVTETIETVVVE